LQTLGLQDGGIVPSHANTAVVPDGQLPAMMLGPGALVQLDTGVELGDSDPPTSSHSHQPLGFQTHCGAVHVETVVPIAVADGKHVQSLPGPPLPQVHGPVYWR
jgi:hypothetical protein